MSTLSYPLFKTGKVREMYDLGDDLLLVASDRISAFDCVLPQPIPDKGAVLTQMSAFWFDLTAPLTPNHCISADPDEIERRRPELGPARSEWAGRGMLVRRATVFPVECVVRGYMAGSAWKEYSRSGTLAGEPLQPGLKEADQLPEPLFSPATKVDEGHDENITFEEMQRLLGMHVAEHLRRESLRLYEAAAARMRTAGLILADTKFEFGTAPTGEIMLIDEALTPDSSRFWFADEWKPGSSPPSLDKQPVRDYLEGLVAAGEWDRTEPAPDLPDSVIDSTVSRYRKAFQLVTGRELPQFA
ncbi:MAG: phosphoribosylaminoimidazolesuccinocarboxamide synthase [Gemmatimonadota bacterium]